MIWNEGFDRIVRYALAGVAVLFTMISLVLFAYGFATTADTIDIVDYDAYRAAALNFVRDDAKLFVDAGILVLAGLWSVAIVSRDERIRRQDVPEIIMLVCATILLAAFFLCDQRYGQELENAYWSVGTLSKQKGFPNINSPYLKLYSTTAIRAFYLSLLISASTVLSLCLLRKDGPHKGESK
jgi:hypothetical protein